MMNEEVPKYRKLSGDNNPNTPVSRIGGFLDGYEKGRADAIDEIHKHIKTECNPYGNPTIPYEIGCKLMTYLWYLKEAQNE